MYLSVCLSALVMLCRLLSLTSCSLTGLLRYMAFFAHNLRHLILWAGVLAHQATELARYEERFNNSCESFSIVYALSIVRRERDEEKGSALNTCSSRRDKQNTKPRRKTKGPTQANHKSASVTITYALAYMCNLCAIHMNLRIRMRNISIAHTQKLHMSANTCHWYQQHFYSCGVSP